MNFNSLVFITYYTTYNVYIDSELFFLRERIFISNNWYTLEMSKHFNSFCIIIYNGNHQIFLQHLMYSIL